MTKAIISTLQNHFRTNWAGRTTILFAGSQDDTPTNVPWVRYTVKTIRPYQREIGSDRVKKYTPGMVYVQCFVPLSRGDGPAIDLADTAALIYQSLRLPGFDKFELPSVENVGESTDGKWYQANCEVEFTAVETIERPAA